MDISIIIVNYNTRDFIEKCLLSIYSRRHKASFEVFVVDNASNDGSVEMVRDKFPSVNLTANPQNTGFGAANNIAMKKSSGEYILLLNSDAELTDYALDNCVDFMRNHPACGIMGGKLLYPDGTTQVSVCPFPSLYIAFTQHLLLVRLFPNSRIFAPHRNALSKSDYEKEQKVDWVSGAFMAVNRKCLEQTGLFDEKFFLYYEETDLCLRCHNAGWEIWYSPSAAAIHYANKTTVKFKPKVFEYSSTSLVYYFLKHKPLFSIIALKAMLFPLVCVRLLLNLPARLAGSDDAKTRAVSYNNVLKYIMR
ncbi:MAG: glycosyltransferase family 2 protein [Planctomycetes bacterium]|nr:glycosyltransferase family 2 protein [Planctomycetota bacterium]